MNNFIFDPLKYHEYAQKYFNLLQNEYKGINLTAIDDFEQFFIKQIKDSTLPIEISSQFRLDLQNSSYILDVGFGGGFPILPLAYTFKNKKFLGIESKEKKVRVVSEIAQLIEQKNIQLIHQRIENVIIDIPNLIVTFKAVGQAHEFLNKLNISKKTLGLKVYFYKGPSYDTEEKFYGNDRWKLIENKDFSFNELTRKIIGFELTAPIEPLAKNKPNLSTINLSKLLR